MRNAECGARYETPRRSVFGNYKPEPLGVPPSGGEAVEVSRRAGPLDALPAEAGTPNTHQASIDAALARSFLYRFLAQAFEDPEPGGWQWLSSQPTRSAFQSAVAALCNSDAPLTPTLSPSDGEREKTAGVVAVFADCERSQPHAANSLSPHPMRGEGRGEGSSIVLQTTLEHLLRCLTPGTFDSFHADYVTCFGHTVRGDCPLNEIEYGDLKADPLFQPHRLADLGAFYAAFGLEMTPDAAERQDHLSIELEFMSVLASKEAYALEHQFDTEPIALGREAQKKFLREHLGRWTPAFTRRLARLAGEESPLGALADFTREFITLDCARFHVTAGSEDLLLRPIDEASETLCASCGITNLPTGATRSPAEG